MFVRSFVRPFVRPLVRKIIVFYRMDLGGSPRASGSLSLDFVGSKSESLVNEVNSWYQPVQEPLFGP